MSFYIPDPELQVTFARALAALRETTLQDALRQTARKLHVPTIDTQLAEYVPQYSLADLAGQGLRGELVFPVPIVLEANPKLIGYYRLLYGYSQKQFYQRDVGGQFKALEAIGRLTPKTASALPEFCRAMARAGTLLLAGVNGSEVTATTLDDLTLLTLGPQLRGGANVKIGAAAIAAVFEVIRHIVERSIESADANEIKLKNAAGRTVLIAFAADPDIVIREDMGDNNYRQVIAIEVKGGSDFSNIHNRIGEAEKSHQKARQAGYNECWTVVNVSNIDIPMAQRESPTTNRFYKMSDLIAGASGEYDDFKRRVISSTGIAV